MTIPLVILAAGSLGAGFVGTPAFLGLGPNRFERWLEPVFASRAGATDRAIGVLAAGAAAVRAGAESPLVQWGLMVAALLLAVLAILLAWRVYSRRPEVPVKVAARLGGLYRLVRDKYRVDEAYDAAVVRPLVDGSRRVLFGLVDVRIVDSLVNLTGLVTRITGNFVAFVQTGQVQLYAAILLLGVAVLLFVGR